MSLKQQSEPLLIKKMSNLGLASKFSEKPSIVPGLLRESILARTSEERNVTPIGYGDRKDITMPTGEYGATSMTMIREKPKLDLDQLTLFAKANNDMGEIFGVADMLAAGNEAGARYIARENGHDEVTDSSTTLGTVQNDQKVRLHLLKNEIVADPTLIADYEQGILDNQYNLTEENTLKEAIVAAKKIIKVTKIARAPVRGIPRAPPLSPTIPSRRILPGVLRPAGYRPSPLKIPVISPPSLPPKAPTITRSKSVSSSPVSSPKLSDFKSYVAEVRKYYRAIPTTPAKEEEIYNLAETYLDQAEYKTLFRDTDARSLAYELFTSVRFKDALKKKYDAGEALVGGRPDFRKRFIFPKSKPATISSSSSSSSSSSAALDETEYTKHAFVTLRLANKKALAGIAKTYLNTKVKLEPEDIVRALEINPAFLKYIKDSYEAEKSAIKTGVGFRRKRRAPPRPEFNVDMATRKVEIIIGEIGAGNDSKILKNQLNDLLDYLYLHKAISKEMLKTITRKCISSV